jgi:hypothetical protein
MTRKAVSRALAHQGLRRIGQESFILVVSRTSDDSAVTTVERPMDLGGRLRRGIRQYRIAKEFRGYRSPDLEV